MRETPEVEDFAETQGACDPLDAFLTKVASASTLPSNKPAFVFQYDRNGCILPTYAARQRLAYRASLSEDTCMSFDEWKSCGYWIKKGAKSQFQDCLGIPQFTIEQVEKSKWQSRR